MNFFFLKHGGFFSSEYVFQSHYSTALELTACNGNSNINSLIDEKQQVVQRISVVKYKAFG